MATCFWQRCTCPTLMPCQEHRGIWCGRFRSRVVAGLADVRNDHVDAAFAVIRRLYYRLQYVTTCRQPSDGWQGLEPLSAEDRSAEQREVDRHLQDQVCEGARR